MKDCPNPGHFVLVLVVVVTTDTRTRILGFGPLLDKCGRIKYNGNQSQKTDFV